MTVAVAPPLRRIQKVDMNAFVADHAIEMRQAIHGYALSGAWGREVAGFRQMFAARRPEWGLGNQVTNLTSWDAPGLKVTNAKIAKSHAPTLSLTLSSHAACRREVDGRVQILNTCPWAGACAAVCVLKHGRGAYPKVVLARNWRTSLLYDYPMAFAVVLRHEILTAARRTGGQPFLARLNVNSDLPWHLIPELFNDVPIQAYDYTKDPSILDSITGGWVHRNYRKIYSWNETSDVGRVMSFLDRGGSVAVVTNRKKGQPIKSPLAFGFESYDVVDGDQSDNRWETPMRCIVDLYAKGAARNRKSPFVQEVY